MSVSVFYMGMYVCMCVCVFPISFPRFLKGSVDCHSINHKCY